MAETFIGMTISVTLRAPSNAVLHGRVVNVIEGQTLALDQVFIPASGRSLPSYNVPSSQIADLQVIEAKASPTTASRRSFVPAPSPHPPRRSPPRQSSSFVDPAILSYGKSPAPVPRGIGQQSSQTLETPTKSAPIPAAVELPINGASSHAVTSASLKRQKSAQKKDRAAKNTEDSRPQDIIHSTQEQSATQSPNARTQSVGDNAQSTQPAKKPRRSKKAVGVTSGTPIVVHETISPDVSRNGNDMNGAVKTKKGWRSTPLLKEASQMNDTVDEGLLAPPSANKGKSKRSKARKVEEQQNGWATEDATDVQDMPEFDFEANHAKFDKRSVFDQIRNEDTTADEDRLVSHNRLPQARPGTYGGKNLHPTENVLSPPLKAQTRSSEHGSTSDADTELNFDSGRQSRSALSRPLAKRPTGRSNSGAHDEAILPLTATITSSTLNRSMSSLRGAALRGAPSIIASSPNPIRTRSPQSINSPSDAMERLNLRGGDIAAHHPHFRVCSTRAPCPSFSPARLRQVEAELIPNLGISAEAISENTARGIAAAIVSMGSGPSLIRRNSKPPGERFGSQNGRPVVVILAGNHTTGARTIAAARHLYGRGFKILVCMTSFENPKVWNPHVAKHIQTLQALGRKAARIEGWRSTSAHIKKLGGPPAVIVDALLDGSRYADIRHPEQQAEAREMIDWANRSRAGVISIASPSGYNASTGESTVLEGEPMAVRPDQVLALGAPLHGLLEAVKDGEGAGWTISVLDIGINVALSGADAVNFGLEWNTPVELSNGDLPRGL